MKSIPLNTANKTQALELYRTMARIRAVEERIAKLYPQQEMRCPVHLCIGQEAVATGVIAALRKEDYVLSGHRSHAHYLAKGGDLRRMIAEIYGRTTGCCKGKGGSMHLVDLTVGFLGAVPIVGSTIPIAVGAAWGSVRQDEPRIAVSFFGDAAIEEGVFHESLNFAALHHLPVIFVCENNFFSVQSPLSVRQPAERPMAEVSRSHGVPALAGDGNDVWEALLLARDAVTRARRGDGPTLLVFDTYRWLEHVGPYPDHELGYRTQAEVDSWIERCPLKRLAGEMMHAGWVTSDDLSRLDDELAAEITEAFEFAWQSPYPTRDALLQHITAEGKGTSS